MALPTKNAVKFREYPVCMFPTEFIRGIIQALFPKGKKIKIRGSNGANNQADDNQIGFQDKYRVKGLFMSISTKSAQETSLRFSVAYMH